MSGPRGFTLIELLLVLTIIIAMAGMTAGMTSKDRKDGEVRAAAEELAATLRLARARAVDQAAVVGVSFNIRNGVGTSGRTLNNHDGGHWYRVVGSDEYTRPGDSIPGLSNRPSGIPRPDFYTASAYAWQEGKTLQGFLRQVQDAWIGDRHTLAPRKVRFLALSDQDNGSYINPVAGGTQVYVASYPRPWFGTWTAGRLHAWGGYDPTITDPAPSNRPCSGFYYQGDEVAIDGCRNPADRSTTWEVGQPHYGIFKRNEGRPLVNGDWLDYVIAFMPDGTACEDKPMRARIASYSQRGGAGGGNTGGIGKGDLGAMTGCSLAYINGNPDWPVSPMTSYADVTGGYAITLASDAERDNDAFGSAREALASIMPAYRVMISKRGQVRVVKVAPHEPAGSANTYLPAVVWTSQAALQANYRYLYRTTASGSTWVPYGRPVETFVTAQVLDGTGGQRWWIAP